MPLLPPLLLLPLLLLAPSFLSADAVPVLTDSQRTDLQGVLDAGLAKYRVPGAIVGMAFPFQGNWVVGSGIGNVQTGAPPQPTDRLRIGSITKTFTATVVLQLVDEGRIALEEPLSKYEPRVPGADGITIRQLLNMTSGLYNFTELDEYWSRIRKNPMAVWTPRELVDLAVANPPLFPPGERYSYCNTNYVLLGMIIEKVTGGTAGGEITRRIVDRLGLRDTSFPMSTEMTEPYMHGYTPADGEPSGSGKLVDFSIYSPTPFWTAGGMISSLVDLKRWMHAISHGELLSRRMHADQLNFSAPNTSSYGLGVMNAGGVAYGHSGEVPGYNLSLYYFPGWEAVSITLLNRYPSAVEGVADEINFDLVNTLVNADPREGFTFPAAADYRSLPWLDAFRAFHARFSGEYAFGEWKGVDWPGLYARFAPRIASAQAAGDEKGWYLALHEYLFSIPDGHIGLKAADPRVPDAIGRALAGGGFGLGIAELDDGRVIAGAVTAGGPAALAGIVPGAEIVAWGGVPAGTAIGKVDVGTVPVKALTGAKGEGPQATLAHRRLEQARLLVRGGIGASVPVVYRNPGSTESRAANLVAFDDGGKSFSLVDFARRPEFVDTIDHRILPEGYGYLLVRMEVDLSNPGVYPTRIYQEFQKVIAGFVAAGVPGVILDLRGNYGGSDELAADMCGFFSSTPSFYEEQEYFDQRTARFLRMTLGERDPATPVVENISVTPQAPHFGGPVVVLVNPRTTSSGEGPAMCISRLPKGKVIGFGGTNGSFGMVGGEIPLPGGYTVSYPWGRSVDRAGVIQLDSRGGVGGVAGVAPNPRVPKTLENVLAFAAGEDVELQFAVRFLTSPLSSRRERFRGRDEFTFLTNN